MLSLLLTAAIQTTRHEVDQYTGFNDAHKYFVDMRAFPNKEVDWAAYQRAVDHREQMPRVEVPEPGEASPATALMWQYVGPRDLDVPYQQYFGLRPLAGRINGMCSRPNGKLFLATAQGGIWKSPAGPNGPWLPLSDSWEALHTSCVAYDESSGWLYAGTGDFHGYMGAGYGIMASSDGGLNWVNRGGPQFGGTAVSAILVDPLMPGMVLVATGRGANGFGYVWRSMDFGNTWTRVINTAARWSDLEGGQGQPMFAVGGKNNGEVWRSTTQGATWTKLTPPISTGDHPVLDIAVAPVSGNVYLLVPKDRKILKSSNAGTSWTDITGAFPHGPQNYNWSQSSYDYYIEASEDFTASPNDLVFVGLIDLACARQASGYAWHSLGGPTYDPFSKLHNDQHCLIPLQAPQEFAIGNDGGIYRMNYDAFSGNAMFDGNGNLGLGITQCYKLAVHPFNNEVVLAGSQDNASPYSDAFTFGPWRNVGGGDGGACEINLFDSTKMFATSQFLGLYLSDDSFASSQNITPNTSGEITGFIAPAQFETYPTHTKSLYGASNYLHRYTWDNGIGAYRWYNRLGNQKLSTGSYVTAISQSPVGYGAVATGSQDSEIWRSNDYGTTWMRVDHLGTPALPDRAITDLQNFTVYGTGTGSYNVALSGTGTGHVYSGTEVTWGGGSPIIWEDRSGVGPGRLPDASINAIDLRNSGLWLAGGDVGMFASTDYGATWKNLTQPMGLPNVQVNDITLTNDNRFIYVATYGRGIWRLPIDIKQPMASVACNPNPVSTPANITLTGTLAGPAPYGGTMVDIFNGPYKVTDTYMNTFETEVVYNGQFLGADTNTTVQLGMQSNIGAIAYTNVNLLRASHMNATIQFEGFAGPRPTNVLCGYRMGVGLPYNRTYSFSVATATHPISIPIDLRQPLNFYIQAPGYLKKAIPVDCTNRPSDFSIGTIVLTCGDIDNDNEIGIGDYALLSSAYNSGPGDSHWLPYADLNHDDAVDIGDYSLLSANYGEIGDD